MTAPRALHRHRRLEPGINLTPMLDVIFNLIFFFILATQLRRQEFELRVNLPQARTAVPREAQAAPPTILVDAQGRLMFKDREVSRAELLLELNYLASTGERRVVIRGDRGVDLGRAIEVLDWCREAGMSEAYLEARRPDEGGPP